MQRVNGGNRPCWLLSMPTETLGLIFKDTVKVLDGMATCKDLNYLLPQHVSRLKLRIKEDADLSRAVGVWEGISGKTFSDGILRFRSTPRLELDLSRKTSSFKPKEAFPNAGWVTVTPLGKSVGWIFASDLHFLVAQRLEIERDVSTVLMGVKYGMGMLSTLTALSISVPCNAWDIIRTIKSNSLTLEYFSLCGKCVLQPTEIVEVGTHLQQCAKLKSFSLSDMNPKLS
eukprot:833134-Rhodomonas_salina.1